MEDSDKVIRAVLAERHAQELSDLEKEYAAKRKMMVDDSFSKLAEKYDRLRDEMAAKHEAELAALEKENLSPEEYEQRRTQLLNKQALEATDLEKKYADEQKVLERGVLTDWEVDFARAKLNLKEKHYKVCGWDRWVSERKT